MALPAMGAGSPIGTVHTGLGAAALATAALAVSVPAEGEGALVDGVASTVALWAAGRAAGSSVRLHPLARSKETAKSRLRWRRMAPVLAGPRSARYPHAVMIGCRTAIGMGSMALVLALASGCGGAVAHNDGDPTAGQSVGGTRSSSAGASFGGSSGTLGRAGSNGNAGSVSAGGGLMDPDPVDSGCPMQDLPPPEVECDPFTKGVCGPGAGCYPFVDHPQGSGCDQQRYGTLCLTAGQGKQGDLCGDGGDSCAEGFVCVVGQRAGKRCAALCKLGSTDQCTGGFICGDLDVAGFGVCG